MAGEENRPPQGPADFLLPVAGRAAAGRHDAVARRSTTLQTLPTASEKTPGTRLEQMAISAPPLSGSATYPAPGASGSSRRRSPDDDTAASTGNERTESQAGAPPASRGTRRIPLPTQSAKPRLGRTPPRARATSCRLQPPHRRMPARHDAGNPLRPTCATSSWRCTWAHSSITTRSRILITELLEKSRQERDHRGAAAEHRCGAHAGRQHQTR